MASKQFLGWTLVVCAGLGVGVYGSRNTWSVYGDQVHRLRDAKKELRESQQGQAKMVRMEARYRTPLGQEEIARQNNYIGKNEVPAD